MSGFVKIKYIVGGFIKMKGKFAKWFMIAILPLLNYYWRYWVTKKIIELEEKYATDGKKD